MSKNDPVVLFADDEPLLQLPLLWVLQDKGIRCTQVETMTAALRYLEKSDVDLLVTDIMMDAGEDFESVKSMEAGYELIRRVRSGFPNLPIMCVSVINDKERIRELRGYHVTYVQKGVTPLEELVTLILRKCSRSRNRS